MFWGDDMNGRDPSGASSWSGRPAPGSEEARALGCRCPVVHTLRRFGLEDGLEWTVMMVEDCPVHGQGGGGDACVARTGGVRE